MASFDYPAVCPLMGGKKISEDMCFELHLLLDHPSWTVPEEYHLIERSPEICKSCPYHHDDI